MILSILTPAVPSRAWGTLPGFCLNSSPLEKLCAELEKQIGNQPVEHLVLLDNKRRTVGEKRDALLRMAHGDYVTFVDDDDWVSEDYVASLVQAACNPTPPDVITFRQEATVNGEQGEIEFGLGNPNDAFVPGGKALRNAWHVCAWRRSLAILSHFPAVNYGEDWAFAEKLCRLMQGLRSTHIDKVLHFYRHDEKTTEAPYVLPETQGR